MAFSASMMLSDLDYIAPSQACILPALKSNKANKDAAAKAGGESGGVFRHVDGAAPPVEDIVKITLADCLACSGCVTTAETLLVTHQSKEEIMNMLKICTEPSEEQPQPPGVPTIVVSISDQSLSSIAVQMGRPIADTASCISGFCREVMKASFVVEMRWARRAALVATAEEFLHRLNNEPNRLPMIVSSCPGWVCYAEKTHPNLIPLLSTVMSPQAIVGGYVKRYLPTINPELGKLYHISVQPCFDKKLEAARGDFTVEATEERDTDCVLSSQELYEWMKEVDPSLPWSGPLDSRPDAVRESAPQTVATQLEGSHGYHQAVMQEVAKRRLGKPLPLEAIEYSQKRNANHRVATFPFAEIQDSEFCVAYGFQHIQNIVRGLNRKMTSTKKYQFIELMACPDGCLNGGGQIRTSDHRATLNNVNSRYEAYNAELAVGPKGCSSNAEQQIEDDSPPSPAVVASDSDDAPPIHKRRMEGAGASGRGASAGLERLEIRDHYHRATPLFSFASLQDWVRSCGQSGDIASLPPVLTTEFHDRKKEMEDEPSQALLQSLKW